ncbi:basic proline-rich protein-like [Meles meles]|uniref:basic proline-rich protein-like n=1 Tax=Meles meles TaxID=9662 RepID=UPI001E69CEBE|nr:basic proline-rich protein-like [Meles meles]
MRARVSTSGPALGTLAREGSESHARAGLEDGANRKSQAPPEPPVLPARPPEAAPRPAAVRPTDGQWTPRADKGVAPLPHFTRALPRLSPRVPPGAAEGWPVTTFDANRTPKPKSPFNPPNLTQNPFHFLLHRHHPSRPFPSVLPRPTTGASLAFWAPSLWPQFFPLASLSPSSPSPRLPVAYPASPQVGRRLRSRDRSIESLEYKELREASVEYKAAGAGPALQLELAPGRKPGESARRGAGGGWKVRLRREKSAPYCAFSLLGEIAAGGRGRKRPPPPPTAAEPERVKLREGAQTPVPFPLGRQPQPEPGKAAAEPKGPETAAPPSPPGRVGRPLGDRPDGRSALLCDSAARAVPSVLPGLSGSRGAGVPPSTFPAVGPPPARHRPPPPRPVPSAHPFLADRAARLALAISWLRWEGPHGAGPGEGDERPSGVGPGMEGLAGCGGVDGGEGRGGEAGCRRSRLEGQG